MAATVFTVYNLGHNENPKNYSLTSSWKKMQMHEGVYSNASI